MNMTEWNLIQNALHDRQYCPLLEQSPSQADGGQSEEVVPNVILACVRQPQVTEHSWFRNGHTVMACHCFQVLRFATRGPPHEKHWQIE
jgi:hypothetical protein